MAKINSMFDIGKRSMMNSQTALQTVAHNIANKTTEGYSRQRVDQVTAVPVIEGNLQIGMGSRAAQISRITNPALDRQLQIENGKLGFSEAHSEALGRVEQVFNELSNKGLNQYISDFFNSWRELANNPESTTSRTIVRESAIALTEQFKDMHQNLQSIENDFNKQVEVNVNEINKMTKEIASLNEKVMQVESQGIPANDQRDRRDLLVKKLNEKIDVKVAEGDHGSITVMCAGNCILVAGYDSKDLQTARNPVDGKTDIYFRESNGGIPYYLTDRVTTGTLGGILAVRDHTLEDMKGHVDELASTLATEVNKVHNQGLDRKGQPTGDFFVFNSAETNPSAALSLADDIRRDPARIASGSHEGAPGDNTVAHVMANIQYQNVLNDGSATMDDYYASNIGQIGAMAQTANKSKETQNGIVSQLNTLRDSVSGVSLDEETVKMIEHQKAFDASARVIRTADEAFDTVLNLKRL